MLGKALLHGKLKNESRQAQGVSQLECAVPSEALDLVLLTTLDPGFQKCTYFLGVPVEARVGRVKAPVEGFGFSKGG